MLVLDSSGSIQDEELQDVRDVAHTIVNALLPDTLTNIGVVEFDTVIVTSLGLTTDLTAINDAIDGIGHSGVVGLELTNWEAAFREASTYLEGSGDRGDNAGHADLIIIITDGPPTTFGYPNSLGFYFEPDEPHAPDTDNAVLAANDAKTSASENGIRIIAVGLSSPDIARLVSISGPNVANAPPITLESDVVTAGFADLAGVLRGATLETCGVNVAVRKVIDLDGNLGTTNDQSAGASWNFDVIADAPDFSAPPDGNTDGSGWIDFEIDTGSDFMATFDMVETGRDHFNFISADCVDGSGASIGMMATNRVNNITVAPFVSVTCTFYNQPDCSFLDDECNDGLYNSATGQCEAAPKGSGTQCNSDNDICTGEQCNGNGSCVPQSALDIICQLPDPPCEAGETCNATTGECDAMPDTQAGTDCELDGDLCTMDHCDGSGSCVFDFDVACAGPVPPCEAGQACDSATGQCVNLPDPTTSCDTDGSLCTIDRCNGGGVCVNVDTVVCQQPIPPCESGAACNPTSGQCEELPDAAEGTFCDVDGTGCTADRCNGTGQCEVLAHVCGACCIPNGACLDEATASVCRSMNGKFSFGVRCRGDANENLVDDLCEIGQAPAVSAWGMLILVFLVATGIALKFRASRPIARG